MSPAARRRYNRDWMRQARANGRFREKPLKGPLIETVTREQWEKLLLMEPRAALAEFHRLNLYAGDRRTESRKFYDRLWYAMRFETPQQAYERRKRAVEQVRQFVGRLDEHSNYLLKKRNAQRGSNARERAS